MNFKRPRACNPRVRKYLALLFSLICLAPAGCALLEQLPTHSEVSPLPSNSICRIAILPFLNDTGMPEVQNIVKYNFYAELQKASNYHVTQEGDISKLYQQLRIYPGVAASLEEMQIVASRVNAQLLITGIIIEVEEKPWLNSTINPKIIMEVQLRDGRTGETLWTAYHRREGSDYTKTMHFGTIHTISGLSRQMILEIINQWFEKGLSQCNVLS